MTRRFRALTLDTSLKSFGKKFTLKGKALQTKELSVEIGWSDRQCTLYYSAEKAERDRKSREIRLSRVQNGMDEIATMPSREGRGRRPAENGVEGRIALLLEKNH